MPGEPAAPRVGSPSSLEGELRRALAELDGPGPVIVTFATLPFAALLENWYAHLRAIGRTRILVIAMDQPMADLLAGEGRTFVRGGFDGSLGDFWVQRLPVFEFLAGHGVDFIHSDLDAVWLKDPVPGYFADRGDDLVFSQGTYHPEPAYGNWGFVLCCGLFGMRASPATAAFLAAVRDRARREQDDQAAVNLVLVEQQTSWQTERCSRYRQELAGRTFDCFDSVLYGRCEGFGLRLALLPHHLFPRLPVKGGGALVKHPGTPRAPEEKIPVLRDVGCWALDHGTDGDVPR